MRSLFIFFTILSSFTLTANEEAPPNIVHECGVSFVHPLKPHHCYESEDWALEKLIALMVRQKNRGRDGAGIGVMNEHGVTLCKQASRSSLTKVSDHARQNSTLFRGKSYLGHVRYATYAGLCKEHCQPFEHPTLHFAIAGNFNMTNTSKLREQVANWGITCQSDTDTEVIMQMIGHQIGQEPKDVAQAFCNAAKEWDGGFFFVATFQDGSFLLCRDPAGIRPGYLYTSEEVIAATSEKSALVEVFDLNESEVEEVTPGTILFCSGDGKMQKTKFAASQKPRSCLFERIYFSQPKGSEIYLERKALGQVLAPKIYDAIDGDLENTVFTYVPNTSLLSFQGLTEALSTLAHQKSVAQCIDSSKKKKELVQKLLQMSSPLVRQEHLIKKRSDKRTFITAENERKELISKIYEVSHAVVKPTDTLVVVEDSIVRGNTLKVSLMEKLFALKPKKIIIVSTSPPICYPDCYGIDMSRLDHLIAFNALIALLEERGQQEQIDRLYHASLEQLKKKQSVNVLQQLYALVTFEELCQKIAQLITPESRSTTRCPVEVVYQTLEGLQEAIPGHTGDWYFGGHYPTPGGFEVVNQSFINWKEGAQQRAY